MYDDVEIERADRLVDKVDQLHSSPQIALRLLDLTRHPDTDVRDVVKCLEKDPALSARVLQVVNSVRYGLTRQTTSLRHAVNLLGQRTLRLVALTFHIAEHMTKGTTARVYQDYWRRALTMAIAGKRLARTDIGVDGDDAYSAGMLADLGVLTMTQVCRERYEEVQSSVSHGPHLVQAEIDAFGCSHPTVGARLLDRWHFPFSLVSAVARHHDADLELGTIEHVAYTSDLVADALWQNPSARLAETRAVLRACYNVQTDELIELALTCRTELVEQASALGIRFDANFDCQALLSEARQQQFRTSLEATMDLDSLSSSLDDHSAS